MKVLILSVSAGGGHKNAAQALEEEIRRSDPSSEVMILDTIRYISPTMDRLIIGTYLNTLKVFPKAYKHLYSLSDTITEDDLFHGFTDKFHEILTEKLIPLIDEFGPDAMISTHPFTAYMLSILRSKYGNTVPNLVVMTDYATHSMWVHPYIDYYIVADECMIPELAVRGIPWDNIKPYGIPVKKTRPSENSREKTLLSLGANPDLKTVTLMGGALAMGNITDILLALDSVPLNYNIVVVTANNKKLYEEASEISLTSEKPVIVLGFHNQMPSLMEASDLLITKPGGLTVTEAISHGLPMLLFTAIPGQETKNAEFLIKNNLALYLSDYEGIKSQIERLLSDDVILSEFRKNLINRQKTDSAGKVVTLLENSIRKHRFITERTCPLPDLEEQEDSFEEKIKSFFRNMISSSSDDEVDEIDEKEPDTDSEIRKVKLLLDKAGSKIRKGRTWRRKPDKQDE